MSSPPDENTQNTSNVPPLGAMYFTYFVPPAPPVPEAEGQQTLGNDQDSYLNISNDLAMTLRPTFTEHQQAKQDYFAFNKHARNFYLNLLIRPSWGRNPEHLKKAFTLGLISLSISSPFIPS